MVDSPVTEKAGESHNSLPGPDALWWSVGVFVSLIEFEFWKNSEVSL